MAHHLLIFLISTFLANLDRETTLCYSYEEAMLCDCVNVNNSSGAVSQRLAEKTDTQTVSSTGAMGWLSVEETGGTTAPSWVRKHAQ